MKVEVILVPTDFSEHADIAFETALDLAKTFGARIELLHAYDFGQWVTVAEATFTERLEERIQRAALERLNPMVERAKADGVEVSTHLVFGTPNQVIEQFANETSPDLIVMGTRGHGFVKHMFLGSVAERTIQTAPCPVMTVGAPVERVTE